MRARWEAGDAHEPAMNEFRVDHRDEGVAWLLERRLLLGSYPVTPQSRLLRNDSTGTTPRFSDQTASMKGLGEAGLISSALWSDANGDGWIDLLLWCEWGPV